MVVIEIRPPAVLDVAFTPAIMVFVKSRKIYALDAKEVVYLLEDYTNKEDTQEQIESMARALSLAFVTCKALQILSMDELNK